VLKGLLPVSSVDSFALVGELTGWQQRPEDGADPSVLHLILPLDVDGVRTAVEFDLVMTDATKVRSASGEEVLPGQRADFLESTSMRWHAVVGSTDSSRLRLLELQELPDGERSAPDTPASPSASLWIDRLSGQGVLPFSGDGTMEFLGTLFGASSTDENLETVELEVPLLIDGVAASCQLTCRVDDRTVLFDKTGREVPRGEQGEQITRITRSWQVKVSKGRDGRLTVVSMWPASRKGT
jgi:hypothetical protein